MKTRHLSAAVFASLLPSLAFGHPGHDDGHELTWDFSHLAAHPLATLGCVAVIVASGWLLWRVARRPDVRVSNGRIRRD